MLPRLYVGDEIRFVLGLADQLSIEIVVYDITHHRGSGPDNHEYSHLRFCCKGRFGVLCNHVRTGNAGTEEKGQCQ